MILEHFNMLICPSCRQDQLIKLVESIECRNCGNTHSTKNHVIDLLPEYKQCEEMSSIIDYINPIMQKLGFQGEQHVINEMRNILLESTEQLSASSYLTAEMQDVIDRFQIFNVDYSISYLKNYFEDKLEIGKSLYRNIRVKNTGKFPWSSKTPLPLLMSYHWVNENREIIVHDGERTSFPVVIESGREITLPIKVTTPNQKGTYVLQIMLVHEGVRWVEESCLEIPIEISESTLHFQNIKRNSGSSYQYQDDHKRGIELIQDFIQTRYNHHIELLEIGCGAHPQIAMLDIPVSYRSINADINVSLLKIGSLFYRYHYPSAYERMTFMSFDANEPPIKSESIDGIVLFSALHHFPEPDRLLETCYGLLKSNGFLAFMCEPVNKTMYDETTVTELSKGINEQVFSEEEYLNLYKGSKFDIHSIQIDHEHSLKSILTK